MPNLSRFKQRKQHYITVGTTYLRDEKLSLAAKGLLSLMLSYSDEVDVNLVRLSEKSTESLYLTRKALDELKDNYYVYAYRGVSGGRFFYKYLYDEQPIDIQKAEKFIMRGNI